MARFKIISKGGESVRYEGKPKYVGTYLKPSYLEFSEIASPFPIEWEVGDYVDYPRTGMKYYLYSIPQASKNARRDASGKSFTYSNVQFFARTKDLEIAPFRDLVIEDNYIHFSTSPDIATYEDVYGIARRIQVCMDDLYPGRWEIRVAEFDSLADAEIVERISTAKDFALSGGTCLDALSKIYELWQEMGWIHSHENGKEVITIGYANKLRTDNATDAFLYGKGNGLTAIKKHQTNKDEFATRLYVYGSERNLPSRYYNGKEILNAESVDIRNLMIPMDSWGRTDGLPDARKAYIENEEAVAKYGIIPRTHYFDSDEAGADIYPSIERMTIGNVRSALDTLGEDMYSPNISIYNDPTERVDEIKDAQNPSDDGVLNANGRSWDEIAYFSYGEELVSTTVKKGETQATLGSFILAEKQSDIIKGKATFKTYEPITGFVMDWGNISKATLVMEITDSLTKNKTFSEMSEKAIAEPENGVRNFELPRVYSAKFSHESIESLYVVMHIKVEFKTAASEDFLCDYYINPGSSSLEVKKELPAEFHMTLKQIGFDISERAAQGEKKCISMKSGACEGRTFNILGCTYNAEKDTWDLQCARQQDDTLGMLFPNADYPLSGGDRFVLLNISMPEIYVLSNSEKLLEEGMKLLERASRYQCNYEPQIDAKVMAESGRVLLEGMYMDIRDEDVVDSQAEHILIDTLSIYEDESAIPTYKVTLREKRKVSYKGTPSATSPNSTKSAENILAEEIDLSDYATKSYVRQAVASGSAMSEWFEFDAEANMIRAKYGLYSADEMAAGGVGEAIAIEGGGLNEEELQNYLDENKYTKEGYVNEKVEELREDIKDNPSGYVLLKTVNGMSLYGSGNIKVEGGSGSEGLTAINVNDKSFQPDENGIVTLPDYPTVPPSLKNPYALTFGNKTYNGSAAKTIVESDIVTDIATIRANATLGAKALQSVPSEYITETELNQKGYATTSALTQGLGGKVDKVSGKGLSTNDYTTPEKNKLASLQNYDDSEIRESIEALESNFSNGKAKDADKLDGHDSSYFASAESVSSLSEIESWYDAVGSKFSKNADGTIKVEGDFYSTGENSAGGIGEAIAIEGGGLDVEELQNYLDENKYVKEGYVDEKVADAKEDIKDNPGYYVPLKTVNGMSLYGSGNIKVEGGSGSEGLTAINVNDKSFQPDENGIVTLPDYPAVPPSLKNPYALTFGNKTYDGSSTKTIVESDIVTDIATIRSNAALGAKALQGVPSEYVTETELNQKGYATTSALTQGLGGKVDKVSGKGLSTNDYTTAEKNKLSSLENYDDSAVTSSISTLQGYFTGGKAKDADKLDGKDSTYYATAESVSSLSAIKAWYDSVGNKFSKDADGTIKVDGDFYSTRENSASAKGEVIGGGGGGIDTDELDDILDQKGYATEVWVNQQGFAKGAIPTRVSQLINDASYITDSTLNASLSGKVDKENGKGLSTHDYTTPEKDKLASLQNYDDSEIRESIENLESNFSNGKAKDADKLDSHDSSYFATSASVSTLQGYFTNGKANKAIADENGENISSNYAKQSWVTSLGYLKATEAAEIYATKETVGGINQRLSALEAWYDKVGIKISYDEVSKAVKVVGDFYSTGENSAGGAGEEILNFEEVLSRLSALENAAAGIPKNIELGISKLSSYDGKEITSATMASLTGLSLDVAIKMTEGAYNKVIDRTGNYAQTWNYSACGTSTGMTVQFRQGDGFDIEKGYSLTYTISTAKWKVIMGEI